MKLHPIRLDGSEFAVEVILTHVNAGDPVEIADEFERVDLNFELTGGNPYAVLVPVRGDSMTGEIQDGDRVLVDRTRIPKPGDIVLAFIEGGYTIKRYKPVGHRGRSGLFLVPSNPDHTPRRVTEGDNFDIVGVVTDLIRKFV